jgi:carboxylesterase type B
VFRFQFPFDAMYACLLPIDSLYVSAATDHSFFCSTRRALRAMSLTAPGVPLYHYYFQYAPKWLDVDILGVYHTLELE